MRTLDRVLQKWRAQVARAWVPVGSSVLDLGCHQGEFLASLGTRIHSSVGLDPLAPTQKSARYEIRPGVFEGRFDFPDESFDVVVMLATLEHILDKTPLAAECHRILRPGGRVLITVPTPQVDRIIDWMVWFKLADGMSLDEHHGFNPDDTPKIFAPHGFELECRRSFQLGLNRLFVLRRI